MPSDRRDYLPAECHPVDAWVAPISMRPWRWSPRKKQQKRKVVINQTKLLIGTVGLALLVGCGDKEATVTAPTENTGSEPAAAAEASRTQN